MNEAKRKAGLATAARLGHEHYVAIGKKGGRPRFHVSLQKAKEREEALKNPSRSTKQRASLRGLCPHCGGDVQIRDVSL